MTFLYEARLWALLAVAALAVVYLVAQLRRTDYAVRFTNIDLLDTVAPKRPLWRRHVPAITFLLALVALVVGWAQPSTEQEVPTERATIMLAIDVSLSMEATDVEPNRMEAAKSAALAFLDGVPDQIRVGLVSFSGIAAVRVPPTTERDGLRRSIESLETAEATAIGEAIFASLDAIADVLPDETGTAPPARIVLMSDGETTVGRPDAEAVEAARQAGVPVSTIAFGTDRGVIRIPGHDALIAVPVNGENLQFIAEETGGQYFSATTMSQLAEVYRDIGSSIGTEVEQREVTTWFVGLALGLLLATAASSLLWFSRLP